ncbi:MAG TPA: rRNA adenine N-6-methyltransferase family protein [Candidatus Angelobacter sp.]|nr:rRNA adenine N-6-methyltransferase family protein [Candidatus Angelobacter sp.]
MDRIEAHRKFYADLITTMAGTPNGRLTAALAATPRERFLGPGPWRIFVGGGYITTPTDDPALLYQDVVVALSEAQKINNGQPVLHAVCLATLSPQDGDTVVHIGAGTGYYTAILGRLTAPGGKVFAYEIEPALAEQAKANLADMPNVTIRAESASAGTLPDCDLIYVNAGATEPLKVWLDALRPNGKLLFPLTPDGPGGTPGAGAMLLITRKPDNKYDARFTLPVMFIPCAGARDEETAKKLAEAFKRGDMKNVRSLRRNSSPDESCWCAGNGWWLSTAVSD